MKKKKLLFACFVAATMLGHAPVATAQIELTVSDGTETDNYIPIWGNWLDDSGGTHDQMLYRETEISAMAGLQITQLTFYATSSSSTWATQTTEETAVWKVGTVDKTTYESTDFFPTESFTTVKTKIVNVENSLLTIEFDEPFIYLGGSLVIDFSTAGKYDYNNIYFYGVKTGEYNSIYSRGSGSSSNTRSYFSPKVTFTYLPGELQENDMRINASEASFKKTLSGKTSTASVKITNMGTNQLTINSVTGLTAPFSASLPEDPIESLKSSTVTFTFAPTEAGEFTQTATINTSAGTATVDLSGTAISSDVPDTWYKETFDNITSDNKIPAGWAVNSSSDTDFSIYDQNGDKGLAYDQDNTSSSEVILVSPYIKGDILAIVRKTSSSGSIDFYTMTLDGGSFSKGTQITSVEYTDALSSEDWSLAQLNTGEEGSYIGIVLNHAVIDLFAAEEQLPVTAIYISNPASAPAEIVTDKAGTAEIPVSFTIRNIGTENVSGADYNIYIKYYDDVLATLDGVDIDAGESVLVETSFTYQIDPTQESERFRIDIAESLSETSLLAVQWITVYTPTAKLSIDNVDYTTLTQPIDLEYFQGPREGTVALRNQGKATLDITDINAVTGIEYQLPEGTTLPVSLEPGAAISMIYKIVTPGKYDGECITFTHNGIGDTSLSIKAVCIDEDTFFENFENGEMPSTWINWNTNWNVAERVYRSATLPEPTDNNLYFCYSTTDSPTTMLISPKMTVSENESLGFLSYFFMPYSTLSVYYSKDRNEWTLAKNITYQYLKQEEEQIIDNIPAGDWYIGFSAGYVGIDNVFGYKLAPAPEHDAMIREFSGSTKGMVNYAETFEVVVWNLLETPDTYTVQLLDGETIIDEVEIQDCELETVTFEFTPHTEGIHLLKAVVSAGDYSLSSPVIEYNVDKESASQDIIVNEGTNTQYFPIRTNYKHSASQLLYTADQLGELEVGAKIASIAFKYGNISSLTANYYHIKVWIGSTEDTELSGNRISIEGLTQIYDGKIELEAGNANAALTYTLPEPMIYDGKNLCIVIAADSTGYGSSLSFPYQKTSAYQMLSYYIDGSDNTNAPDRFSTQEASLSYNLPELRIGIAVDPVSICGIVTDTHNTLITDATLIFTKGNVIYTSQTDETGVYFVSIFQQGDYNVSIEKEGYGPFEVKDPVTIEAEDMQKDFVIELIPTGMEAAQAAKTVVYIENGICYINAAREIRNVQVISVSGQTVSVTRPNRNDASVSMRNMPAGIYLINVTTTEGSSIYKVLKR